jgi:bacterioferritin-associated ferredoxin
MTPERAELIDAIRATARAMAECSIKMMDHGVANANKECVDHACEIMSASVTALTWAEGLEE